MGEQNLLTFTSVTQTIPYGQANILLSLMTSRVARPSLSHPSHPPAVFSTRSIPADLKGFSREPSINGRAKEEPP